MKKIFVKSIALFLISTIVITVSASILFAQESASELIRQGQGLMNQNRLEEAAEKLKGAIDLDESNWKAYHLLGEVEMRRSKWGKARGYFQYLVKRRPNDLLARYNLAICYRESGKFLDPLRRYLFWRKSRNHFQYVIKKDIRFRDVVFQFAVLQRYRRSFKTAVALAEQQLRVRPEIEEVQVRIFRLYDYLIENSGKDEVRKWLSSKDYPRAEYFIGEILRRQHKLAEADSVFQDVISHSRAFSLQPVYLSLARLYVQLDKDKQAEQYFWQAVESITSNADADLIFEDVKYVVNDDELHTYQKLNGIKAKKQYFHKLWGKRDPMPASAENVRLIEHYRRMLKSEKYYRYDGFRSWMNNPDRLHYLSFPEAFYLNDKFNDKGLIYLRHGEPDENAITMGANEAHNESWLYYQNGNLPKLMFHFMISEQAAGNNWRLTPHLEKSWIEDRITWDNIFHRYYNAEDMELGALEIEMARKANEDVKVGFETDRHTWPSELEPLVIPFYTAIFRGEHGKNLLEFYYGISSDIIQQARTDSNFIAEAGLVVYDGAYNELYKDTKQMNLKSLTDVQFYKDYYIGQWSVPVWPNRYIIGMHFRIAGTFKIGGYRFQQNMFDYRSSRLALSSIELAHLIESNDELSGFIKHDLNVVPNPGKRFDRTDPVNLYYEIYNLKRDAQGKTAFTIEHKLSLIEEKKQGLFKKVFGFMSKNQQEISSAFEREGQDETSIEHIALDLSSSVAGKYRLTVTVHDHNSNANTETSTEFQLN